VLVTVTGTPAERLGLEPGAPAAVQRETALTAVGRWRDRAGNPMTNRITVRACEVMPRSYEGIYSSLVPGGNRG
jgi:hypothetical protein